MSPRVLISYKDLAFYFYSNEQNEPMHIHVAHKRSSPQAAKFWVGEDGVIPANPGPFSKKELHDITIILGQHRSYVMQQWGRTFGTVNFYEGPKQNSLRSMDLD